MDIVNFVKNIASFVLIAIVLFFTAISILRIKKKNPPKFVLQYIRYLNMTFFIFGIPVVGFIITPAGDDFSIFLYLTLTLIAYVLFYVFAKGFRYKHFKYAEQGLNMYVYVVLLVSFFALSIK